ncbi:MAG: O-methyltransferase [Planctomycetota bacterium]
MNGAVPPLPDLGKQRVVIEHIERFSLDTFVETGTYKGRMVYALIPHAREIYSIELDETHFKNARRRFAGNPNVHILQGQSGEVLPRVLKDIDKPCLFWLDAHYSGGSTARGGLETPIMQELGCILAHARADGHVILIDDARCFTGENDYPSMKSLEEFIWTTSPSRTLEVRADIIRIYPDGSGPQNRTLEENKP